jgi:CelD/BcsL family acetyltransferase involved in cellulose biosynthesis
MKDATMPILCVDPRTDPLWKQLVEKRTSSVFHAPAWLHVLHEAYGLDVRSVIVVNDAGEPLAGLPFCHITDIVGDRVVSLPFSDYCDPLVEDEALWQAMVETLPATGDAIVLRCLHNRLPLRDPRFTPFKKARWHGLSLQPDLEVLWQNLHGSARRAIKKAERSGVIIRLAEDETELRAFFELHLQVRQHKYRLLAQPYQMFASLWKHFIATRDGCLLLATYQDQIIAGILFLAWKDTLYYKFNASALDHLAPRPNDLMMWEAIQYARARGYAHLDFGLSDWDQEGLVRYKRKFASEEKSIEFLRYAPASSCPSPGQQVRSLLPQLTDLFTEPSVPAWITEKAGELLYKYFA